MAIDDWCDMDIYSTLRV